MIVVQLLGGGVNRPNIGFPHVLTSKREFAIARGLV